MKRYITYFSNLRYLDDSYLPINTTIYPPAFFNTNGLDKTSNGIYLGVTAHEIIFPHLGEGNSCPCAAKDPTLCGFIKNYLRHLQQVDFKTFEAHYSNLAARLSSKINKVVLVVYEKPDNPCSERGSLIEWFKENGIELEEFRPPSADKKKKMVVVESLFTK